MPEIILYGYATSPYYQKVILVLNFLRLPFSICLQPNLLPRPDFDSVGITYRRIPLLSIDGHVYADTSLIISKLCDVAGTTNDRETELLGASMFPSCAGLIPFQMIADEAFLKDRAQLTGRPWSQEAIKAGRPKALSSFLSHLAIVDGLVKAGNGYVKAGQLTLADLHLAYVIQWVLQGHKGAQPEVSQETHPAIYAWLDTVREGTKAQQRPGKISFTDAKKSIVSAKPRSPAPSPVVDPLKPKIGSEVKVVPTDTGRSHPQAGKLVFFEVEEVCVQTSAGVYLSFPRLGYAVSGARAQKL